MRKVSMTLTQVIAAVLGLAGGVWIIRHSTSLLNVSNKRVADVVGYIVLLVGAIVVVSGYKLARASIKRQHMTPKQAFRSAAS